MLRGGYISIGRAFGIPVRIHYSWFFVFAIITWTLAASYFPSSFPEWSLSTEIGAGLITSLLFFGSVLSHELCHSLVARRQGIKINSITLFFFGGVAQINEEPRTARDEFWMAVVGPVSSIVLGIIMFAIFFALNNMSTLPAQLWAAVTYYLGFANILLGVFNLVPGFPLDGGRVLRSIIWWRTKNMERATRIASYIGRAFGVLFIIGGVILAVENDLFDGIWLALIGLFLERTAAASYRRLPFHNVLKGHTAGEIMSQNYTVVAPDITVQRLVNENILNSGRRCFPVVSNGRTEGIMTIDDVRALPNNAWGATTVRQAMMPLEKVKSVLPNDDLNTVLEVIIKNNLNQVPVVWQNSVVGIVARDAVIDFARTRTEIEKR